MPISEATVKELIGQVEQLTYKLDRLLAAQGGGLNPVERNAEAAKKRAVNGERVSHEAAKHVPLVVEVLRNIGAIGHHNARPREKVLQVVRNRPGGNTIGERMLRWVGSGSRDLENIRNAPDLLILCCRRGLYVVRDDPDGRAEDMRVCADWLASIKVDEPVVINSLRRAAELIAHPTSDLFPDEEPS